MKATVEQYARGDYRFQRPEIILSEQQLQLKIEAGSVYHGILTLSNVEDMQMKVMVYDERYLFTFSQHVFVERKCHIKYSFDGSNYEQGKTIRGKINVVTDGGEFVVPYTVEIVAPYVITSIGNVKDMFQFANLAEKSWKEAVRLFESPDFENTFLQGQPQLMKVYDSLRFSLSVNQALEEFLVFIHKKKVLMLSVAKDVITMEMPTAKASGTLRISRNTWGFTNTVISSDSPFLTLGKKLLTSEDFFGNDYTLEFFVNPDLMEAGGQVAHITIENVFQKLQVEIIIGKGFSVTRDRTEDSEPKRIYKASILRLVQSYIDFRIGRMELHQYVERSLFTLQNLIKCDPEENLFRLGVLHMQLLMGETEYVRQECLRMEADDVYMIHGEMESCYYQYIKAMLTKDAVATKKTAAMLEKRLDSDNPALFYYWLYMHVEETLREDKMALYRLIERLYMAGMRSPIMYLEICDIFNQEPLIFRKLGPLEQGAIHWGLKEQFVSSEIRQSYVLLAAKERSFTPQVFHNLEFIYEENPTEECLKVMVAMLITGNQLDNRYHKYYALAIDASLKLIGLNECFLRSMDMQEYDRIPYQVLKYLNYKNTLTEAETAYLYANIIVNKDDYINIYHEYVGNIEAFMGEQILKGNMSDDLSIIYAEFLDPAQVSEKYAFQLVNIIFKRKLICSNSHIKSVVVKHKEMGKEVVVPVKNGVAYIEIITDNASISLLDEYGNRYISTISYRLEKLVEERFYIDLCYKHSPGDYRLLLYLYANTHKLLGQNIQEINLARELIHKKQLSSEKKQEALVTMISYYDAHYDSSILQKYLEMVNVECVKREQSGYLAGLMIQEGLYKRAYGLIKRFGFQDVQEEVLLRLVSFLTNEGEFMHDELLTAICVRLYEHDRYGEAVLKHLSTHYRGLVDELCTLWKRCRGILSDVRELEENALAQILFTDQTSENIYDLFSSYYYGRNRGMLVKGFLKRTAFRYVVGGAVIPTFMFDIIYNEIELGNLTDDLSAMALLMYYSSVQIHPTKFDWIRTQVKAFVKRGKILPFYKAFKELVALPEDIYCKTYLIYRGEVHRKVKVNYSFDSVTDQTPHYTTEVLNEMLPGLYVKEFVVFRGERLLYSIEDDNAEGSAMIVENDVITEGHLLDDGENRFAYINTMLKSQEMRDDNLLIEDTSHYLHMLHLFEANLKILS